MDLQAMQPQVMAIFGAILQYFRAWKSFSEPVYHATAIVLAAAGYVLFNPLPSGDWRSEAVKAIIGISGLTISIWGGTFVASNSAKAGITVFPMTNSK